MLDRLKDCEIISNITAEIGVGGLIVSSIGGGIFKSARVLTLFM
jgi:hypothetical protein